MSRNREVVKPVEYSESEEDDDASSGEEESDSEPEQPQPQTLTQRSSAKPQQAPQQPPPSSSEESGSETDSDSDEVASNAKPKPVVEPQTKSSNGAKKPAAAKRPAAESLSTPKVAKKKKTSADGPETSGKKSVLFQRIFTEEDEIVILQGMIDYRSEKKIDPATNLQDFHEFIKRNLHKEMTWPQVKQKMRRLKEKYQNIKRKENKLGKARHFSKSHEQLSYELSKLVWPDLEENGAMENPKAIKKAVAVAAVVREVNSGGGSSMEELVLKTGRETFEAGKGAEGENDWRKLRVKELKLYLKQLEIRAAQTKLVLGHVNP